MSDIVYKASPTLKQFHADSSFVRAVMGPIGSGKSVACSFEIMKKALSQQAFEGIRDTKWAVIRNTYRELTDTTIRTWMDWFGQLGTFRKMDLEHHMEFPLEDGTTVRAQILFRALDKPDDIKKLLSLELTGMWINEAREVPKQVLEMGVGRVGRYPSKRKGGATWSGVIMDTNPPDSDHWFQRLFEHTMPKDYTLYKQPSGLAEDAENISNLPDNYYPKMCLGKDEEWINVYAKGKYGYISDGMPIYPEFNTEVHVSNEFIDADPALELWIGIDFGRTPAVAFAQQSQHGQWRFIDEITTTNMGALIFARDVLGPHLRKHFRDYTVHIFGDPAGDDQTQVSEDTAYDILASQGIDVLPAPSQDPVIRREALSNQMIRMTNYGEPRLQISPKCETLIKGMAGGFKYRRLQVSGEERYQNVPDKNRYSHICEAAEYLLVGAGEDPTEMGQFADWDVDFSQLNAAAG